MYDVVIQRGGKEETHQFQVLNFVDGKLVLYSDYDPAKHEFAKVEVIATCSIEHFYIGYVKS